MDENKQFKILVSNGTHKVRIEHDGFDLYLHTMRNGFQWVGQPVDDTLIRLLKQALAQYDSRKENE